MIFKRPSAHYGKTPAPETPYQRAAQAWDDRIGSARVQAKNWRLMAFGCLFLTATFAATLLWQSTRGTVVPWVVEVDRFGEARTVAPAADTFQPSEAQIAWHLARFIEHVRAIPADPVVLRNDWLGAYDFATSRGAAALNDYARENDPFTRADEEQVSIEVSSVVRASDNSFRVAWTERSYRNGQLANAERWSAILTIRIRQPRDAERLRKNPLGIYVDAISWSKEFAE